MLFSQVKQWAICNLTVFFYVTDGQRYQTNPRDDQPDGARDVRAVWATRQEHGTKRLARTVFYCTYLNCHTYIKHIYSCIIVLDKYVIHLCKLCNVLRTNNVINLHLIVFACVRRRRALFAALSLQRCVITWPLVSTPAYPSTSPVSASLTRSMTSSSTPYARHQSILVHRLC